MGDRVVVAIVGVTAAMTGVITEEGRPRGGCDVVVVDDDDVEKATRRLTTGKKEHATIHGIDADVDRSTAPAVEQSSPRDRIISL